MENDYDFSVCAIHYLRVLVSAELCNIQNGKARLTEAGRELHGEWSSLAPRYVQLTLDALHVMPNFIHGILVINLRRQKILEVEHRWSQNVRYSFSDIVNGFQNAVRKRRYRRPIGLQSKYYFSAITDQPVLGKFRELIWAAPKAWDDRKKQFVGSDWPTLQQGRIGEGLTAPCPYCDPAMRPRTDKVRFCGRHNLVIRVPADPSKPIIKKLVGCSAARSAQAART
jgi:REP element-mobilizing transposase RayT